MKLFSLLAAAALTLGAADLTNIRVIYLLPMSGGLDQFLAVRLSAGGLVQVSTDPQKADAVLTDSIGPAFEEQLAQLYATKPADGKSNDPNSKDKLGSSDFAKPTMKPLAHARGNIFLVDRKTGAVLWSLTERAKNGTPDAIRNAADHIASKLEKDYKGK
jgi:hypothetical protein